MTEKQRQLNQASCGLSCIMKSARSNTISEARKESKLTSPINPIVGSRTLNVPTDNTLFQQLQRRLALLALKRKSEPSRRLMWCDVMWWRRREPYSGAQVPTWQLSRNNPQTGVTFDRHGLPNTRVSRVPVHARRKKHAKGTEDSRLIVIHWAGNCSANRVC